MLAESGLPSSFWGEALASYVHVWNRLPTTAIPGATTPYELWHGTKPDVSHLRVWGCTAYICACAAGSEEQSRPSHAEMRLHRLSSGLQGLEVLGHELETLCHQ